MTNEHFLCDVISIILNIIKYKIKIIFVKSNNAKSSANMQCFKK